MISNRTRPVWVVPWLVVFALFFAAPTCAQDYKPEQGILVLPTTAPGAPTASDIVTYYYTPPGKRSATPPLQALTVANPTIANYLLPVRAQGDQLSRLNANPTSPAQSSNVTLLSGIRSVQIAAFR